MRVSKEVEVKDIISFSGLEEDVRSVNIPKGRYDYVKMFIDYTVTDVGIEAGENFSGVVNYIEAGEGDNKAFEVHTDEIEAFIAMQEEDHDARFVDGLPTTATEEHAYYVFEGPFNFTGMAVPQLTVAIQAPTAEFAGASAFTAKIRFVLVRADNTEDASGVVYKRSKRGADVLHQVPLGPGSVTDILILGTNIDEISLPSADGMGGMHASDMDVTTKYPIQFVDNYNLFKNPATRVEGRYLIEDRFTEYYAGRRLTVECSDAQAITVFAKNVVVYA